MNKNVLELKEPIVSCYTSYGALFSIIPENMMPWVYNNFIQIRYAKSWDMLTFDNHRMFIGNCPGISFYIISKTIFKNNFNTTLKNAIIEAINANQYIFMYIDRYYLPGTKEYETYHFEHEIFIYGYDLHKDIVYAADNFQNGKYMSMECSFSALENGYRNIENEYDFITDIRFISVKPESQSYIDIDQIIDGIERYLYSRKTFDMLYEQDCYFGINIINMLKKHIDNNFQEDSELDIRTFHLLYEHKILMELRIKYLIDLGYLPHKNIEIDDFIKLKKEFLKLRNIALKYNVTKQKKLLSCISKFLHKSTTFEQSLLEKLLVLLKNLQI